MPVRCVVPISGGKDSQACLKLALQQFRRRDVLCLFCDTGFEHPITYAHIEKLHNLYGRVRFQRLQAGHVLDVCERFGRFPSGLSRHCTDYLKIRPTKRFLVELAQRQGCGFEVWYGMRLDESSNRRRRYASKVATELYAPHEIMPSKYPQYLNKKLGVFFRLPILNWQEKEVLSLLKEEVNPLYAYGFPRVGCFPCLASAPEHQKRAFSFDAAGADHWQRVQILSRRIGKEPFTSAGSFCAVCSI